MTFPFRFKNNIFQTHLISIGILHALASAIQTHLVCPLNELINQLFPPRPLTAQKTVYLTLFSQSGTVMACQTSLRKGVPSHHQYNHHH